MQLRFFRIPASDSGEFAAELNAFLRANSALAVQRELVQEPGGAWWAICVEYLSGTVPAGTNRDGVGKGKVDYKDVLSAEDFAVFSRLRQVRKELAERDAVPVYAVFTNEQIAAIVTGNVASLADLRRIDGVGEARVEKYGEALLSALRSGVVSTAEQEVGP